MDPQSGDRTATRYLHFSVSLVLTVLLASASAHAQATDWPSKPVNVVVGYAAGGNTDVMARIASKSLTEDLKQSFVVDNRIGAGGAIAATYVAQAAPDGYTLFFAASPQIAIVPQVQKVNYDPWKDFAPVSIFGTGPFILGISSAIPARTLAEFVAYAKTRKINYGSSGAGSVAHLAAALLASRAGFDAVHVPFRGSGQVTAALLGGQIDMFFGNASDLVPQAESGKLTILAVCHAAADEAASQRADDRRNVSGFFAGKLERPSGSGQDSAADYRQARQARDRRRARPRQRRAAHRARHRAERNDARTVSRADRGRAAAIRCRHQGSQSQAGIVRGAPWKMIVRGDAPQRPATRADAAGGTTAVSATLSAPPGRP